MERLKLNRIKAVLVETGHTNKWLSEQLGKDPVTVYQMVYQYVSARFANIGQNF